ncbi:gamma-glutamyltransferase family protein [Ammoniphilus oxalaticus]|nr:gamma-glutamyltransferase family protein [Ammoniphilus oxalaticus]
MVATSQPLAAQAGMDILKKGGNAIDAAIATAACLTVVEPSSNGIGGDAYAIVWVNGEMHGLNASGPSPQGISIEAMRKKGYSEMPKYGLTPVTVPGAPASWAMLSERFGKLPLKDVLQPAIDYAENGFPVPPTLSFAWNNAFQRYNLELPSNAFSLDDYEVYQEWYNVFAPNGRAPRAGEMWKSPDHAKTLRSIAETNAESFYHGEIADKIDALSKKYGGFIRKEDLQAYKPQWVKPISVNYRGYDVWEIPPNGQGLIALHSLNMLKGFDFHAKEMVETYHKQIEAMKLAFADGLAYITQEDKMEVAVKDILSEEYAQERREHIGEEAQRPFAGTPPKGGTVYLATADGEGNMVSFIQSNYMSFGSCVVVPDTGIALQNRGANFSLDPEHANRLEPNKLSFNTIIPGFLTKDGKALGPFGVMGGFMQPQGHVQVVMNMVDFGMNPQAALDAPRFQWTGNMRIELETAVPEHIALALAAKGHDIHWSLGSNTFGRGQIILRDEDGVLSGGTEARTDGSIAAW